MTTTAVRRPFGVSLLSILLIVVGFFDLVAGIVLLATRNDADVRNALRDVSQGSITTLAIVTIGIGVVVLCSTYSGSGTVRTGLGRWLPVWPSPG